LHAGSQAQPGAKASVLVYVGTYTGEGDADSKGIYTFAFDSSKASLKPLGLAVVASNPTYVLIHPSQRYILSIDELDHGQVNVLKIDSTQTGKLTLINRQSSHGSYPIYISSNKRGEYIFVANYMSGTVAVLPFDAERGILYPATGVYQQNGSSIDPESQTSSHAHCVLPDQKEEYAISADLGSDELYVYRFLSTHGMLEKVHVTKSGQPGDGPRHLIFSDDGNYVYLMNELTSTISVFEYSTILKAIQTISTLPTDFKSVNYGAELHLHPTSGRFLYASNRGHDSIAVFTVDKATGLLTLLQHVHGQGHTPRHFNILPDGKHLIVANQDSNNLVIFSIDQTTGKLTCIDSSVHVTKPTCVMFMAPQVLIV
jgi:6-phosphogluconolactonase